MAMMASSCAGGSDGAAAELETLRADSAAEIADIQDQAADELAAASSQVEALEATVAEQADTIVELTDTVDQAAVELASQVDETERVESQLSRTNRELTSAERRADDAEEQVDELLIRYDAEIRVDAQAAWDTEVTEACTDAGDGTLTIRNYVDHTDQLAIIGTEAELIALVTDCAEPLRNRSIEERLSAECEQGSADQVTKDPRRPGRQLLHHVRRAMAMGQPHRPMQLPRQLGRIQSGHPQLQVRRRRHLPCTTRGV